MSFRQRLVLFLVATLVAVQVLTAIFVYGFVRGNLVQQGRSELQATASVFMRQLNVLSERVGDDVQVLSLDYALRKAVAEQDQATALSALRNHGSRIGATRSMIVGLEGRITADTANLRAVGTPFPFTGLIDEANNTNQGTALAVLDGGVYWIIAVPVRAPVPIAYIVACVPVDDALLEKLRQLSSVPQSLAIATVRPGGNWTVVAKTTGYPSRIRLPSPNALPPAGSIVDIEQENNRLAMLARLSTADASQPIFAILDYPLDEILSPYRAVITPMLLVLGGALLAALFGAMLIARGVSRPLELLAVAARRIAKGDYRPLPALKRNDEIGELSSALLNMTGSIAEREAALKNAVGSLEIARNDAVKANEAKSQFLSNMSHELRTPLNAILGFSEMINRQLLGPINVPRYAEYAAHIHQSGAHLLVEVEEMLALSQAADGRLAIERKPLKPGRLIDGSLESFKEAAGAASVRLEFLGESKSWPGMDGDQSKLQHGLDNIVHNAIKFTPAGGRVTVSGTCENGVLRIVVADTGIGIDPEELPFVVQPFHRTRPAYDANYQGVGLGLPYAKTIVELHGGKLSIESTQGVGTTVIIELPLAVPAAVEDAA